MTSFIYVRSFHILNEVGTTFHLRVGSRKVNGHILYGRGIRVYIFTYGRNGNTINTFLYIQTWIVLTVTGELWTWGNGGHGQLGHGTKGESWVPKVVNGTGVVTGMASGLWHSLLTTATGSVSSFGSNIDYSMQVVGYLGLGAEVSEALTPRVIPGITIGGAGEGKRRGG